MNGERFNKKMHLFHKIHITHESFHAAMHHKNETMHHVINGNGEVVIMFVNVSEIYEILLSVSWMT